MRSDPTTVVNLEMGYRFGKRFSVSLAAYNLFDSDDNDITYFYESQLPGEGAPVEDRHFHPVEPRTLRLTRGNAFLTEGCERGRAARVESAAHACFACRAP